MKLTFRLIESGGYDAMTDCFFIEDEQKNTVATVDLRHYGQENCEPASEATLQAARDATTQLVDRFNSYDTFKKLVPWLEALQKHEVISPQSTFWELIDQAKILVKDGTHAQEG